MRASGSSSHLTTDYRSNRNHIRTQARTDNYRRRTEYLTECSSTARKTGVSPLSFAGATPTVLFQNQNGGKIGVFWYGGGWDPYARGDWNARPEAIFSSEQTAFIPSLEQLYSDNDKLETTPRAVYSGVTTIYGVVPSSKIPQSLLDPLSRHQSIRTISPHEADEPEPNHESVRDSLIQMYGKHPAPIPNLIQATDHIYYWPVFRLAPIPDKWYSSSGRVVLIGDAAHAMPPHAAQGVGMGIEDSVLVARVVSALEQRAREVANLAKRGRSVRNKVGLSAELWAREYQAKRVKRVNRFVKHAESQGRARKDSGWKIGILREWMLWVAFPLINFFGLLAVYDIQGWGYDPDDEIIKLDGL
ncbi:FAD binding domain [Rhizoctonia solani]|uniref:FAD binding domain n=1 Tax=Rhizoctonia solani TaxID=456999 RepID=A0A8H7I7Y9_9AGAM|nr:FAD binding domain [Rhizoctonia solani]